jgi:hypothetical protein
MGRNFDSVRSPSWNSDEFWGLCANSIFSSILRKISARFQSAAQRLICKKELLQKVFPVENPRSSFIS